MDELEDLEAVTEPLNAGAPIATINPYLVEQMWEAFSRIPRKEGQLAAVSQVAVQLNPNLVPQNPEQKLAMMARYALLNAVVEWGVLDEYMSDPALRKKVFATAALLPCDQNDLREAVAQKAGWQPSRDDRQKKKNELMQPEFDADRPKLAEKFIKWLSDNA